MADVSKIMDWEDGKLTPWQEVAFFADLIRTGEAWQLQGMYGRRAVELIKAGLITRDGRITGPGNRIAADYRGVRNEDSD